MRKPDRPEDSTQREVISTQEVVGAFVEVTRGPDTGVKLRLEAPSLTIGKGSMCGLRLTDQTVSREHVRLELGPSGLVVHDGGSKNGTWIGPLRIQNATLTADTSLKLGATTIAITLDATKTPIHVSQAESFGSAYARSVAMRHVFAALLRAAPTGMPILIEGESGVGKELLARAVHMHSGRSGGPFVAIDCGAIPPDLVESELFGHERGAFTGAQQARVGLFQQADGGTVFLDELGELPIDLQPKLLRVLELREVRPVGGSRTTRVDVRIVSATNRNLRDRIAEGSFREDLFYRVAAVRLRVPPLRERPDDIGPLATRFLRDLTGDSRAELSPDILAMLGGYSWPGNVRELRNVVQRVALLDARNRRELFDATGTLRREAVGAGEEDLSGMPFQEARKVVLDRLEAAYFPAILKRAGGVVSHAAELSGLARSSFYRMLERVGEIPDPDSD